MEYRKEPGIRTLLFDVDNTLIDFTACEKDALEKTFAGHRLELNEDTYQRYQSINHDLWRAFERGEVTKDTVLLTRFGALFEQTGIKEDGRAFEAAYQAQLGQEHVLYHDTVEMLEYLSKKYEIYYLTNGVAKTQASRLQLSGIDVYAKDVFVSELIGHQKPSMEFFRYCMERMENFDTETALMIGDSLTSDIKGGNNAGIKTCWLNPERKKQEEGYIIDYEIACLSDLKIIGL